MVDCTDDVLMALMVECALALSGWGLSMPTAAACSPLTLLCCAIHGIRVRLALLVTDCDSALDAIESAVSWRFVWCT